jgi:hypothetical protein
MNKGVVILSHNNRKIDYSKMSIIAAKFAAKHLGVPVSLITDKETIEWLHESQLWNIAESVFDQIITTERPDTKNQRILYDGTDYDRVPFLNSNRSVIWHHTPYERTLLIDSDFIVCSDNLNHYWDVPEDVLLSGGFNDIQGDRYGVLDRWVSETGTHLYWATTVMFTKNETSKIFFQLVDYVRENYKYYADLFRFRSDQYRNDISFSVAKHILDGFEKSQMTLPPVLTVQDKDILEKINNDGRMIFSVQSKMNSESFYLTSIKDQDIHIMNKQSIIRHFERLISL